MSKELVTSHEKHITELDQDLNNWTIPKISTSKIYETGLGITNLFKHDYIIETTEKSLSVNPEVETQELLDMTKLEKIIGKYRFMHIGLVQMAIKPLHKIGLNTPIVMCLRDARFKSYADSILAVCESNLVNGPVYFNCYPNFSVDLKDKHLSKVLTLNMRVPTSLLEESANIIIIYRIYYKVMKTHLSPKAKIESVKNSTVLIEANFDKLNVHTPTTIQWDKITFPDSWLIPKVNPPKEIKSRTQPMEIIEDEQGNVEILFKPREKIESSRRSYASSNYTVNNQDLTFESLKSKSERTISFKGVDWLKNIPQAQYEIGSTSKTENKKSESPPMSPTLSDMAPSAYIKQI